MEKVKVLCLRFLLLSIQLSGTISWCGQSIQNCLQDYKQLFLLPHETGFYEEFTPIENLTFFVSLHKKEKFSAKALLKRIIRNKN